MNYRVRQESRRRWLFLLGMSAMLGGWSSVDAQESVRPSLTGAIAAEARHPTERKPNYNFRTGPVTFDMRGSMEVEFNDNVNLSEDNRESDIVLRPSLTLNAFWQVTKLNALTLDLGVGYAHYINQTRANDNTILIAPNSQIGFDIFAGDFRINIHDRFSIREDPIDEGTLSNVANFTRFENAVGVSVLWDLNDVKAVFTYDFYTLKSITGEFDILDRQEHQVGTSLSFNLADGLQAGLEGGFSAVDYDENFNNDALVYHAGAFVEARLSNYLKLRLAGGYQAISFESGGANDDQDDASGPYAVLSVANRLNRFISQELSVGYETRLGINTNYVENGYARYNATWQVHRIASLRFDAFWESLSESNGFVPEDSQRFGAGIGLDVKLTKKSSVGVRYEFVDKDSDLSGQDYRQNRAFIQIAYDF